MIHVFPLFDFGRVKGLSLVLFGDYCALRAHEFGVAGANIGSFEGRKA